MKRLLPAILLFVFIGAHAQDADSLARKKSRWGGAPLPILSYNSDLGFQFGVNADLYDFGTGRPDYPSYHHKVHFEASHYTKGQTLAAIDYDSSHLIRGLRISASFTWQNDPLYAFYGFGGDVTKYDSSIDKNNGVAYYDYKRNLIRMNLNVQGKITPNLRWIAGLSLWDIQTSDISFGNYDATNTLYNSYVQAGVISGEETGGTVLEARGGIVFDTRDFEPEPTKGIWTELYLVGAPTFRTDNKSYLKLAAHFRHYITPGPSWLTFAYHAAAQITLLGEAPFYMQQNIYNITPKQVYADGLGGSNTVRGLMPTRLLGAGYVWGNFEVRARFLKFKLWGFDLAGSVNPFVDFGMIAQPIRLDELSSFTGKSTAELRSLATKPHGSAGIGFKGAANRNLILSVEFAKPFNRNDGNYAFVITTNYVF